MPGPVDISRRSILLSAFAALTLASTRSVARSFRASQGCFIAPQEFSGVTMYNKRPTSAGRDIRSMPILGSSNKEGFDRALGRVLSMMSGEFGVVPGFGYYDDSAGNNALATPVTRIRNTKGTVLFGIGLLDSLLSGRDGDIAVLAVCAHEFAHILQYETGAMDKIKSRLPDYCAELYADFLAGYFLQLFRRQRPSIGVQGVGVAWEGLGSSDFNKPGTHGTSRQRVQAIEAGYFFADKSGRDVDRAISEAYDHVSRYG